MLVRLGHWTKAFLPMLVTELGIVTLLRLEQELKAFSPMLVTESGIMTLMRLEQLEKAKSPMRVTFEGTTSSRVWLHGRHATWPRGSFISATVRP